MERIAARGPKSLGHPLRVHIEIVPPYAYFCERARFAAERRYGPRDQEEDMYFHLYKDAAGQWRWRLVAGNNQIVATSGEGYVNKADAEHGIGLVKGTNASTPVRE